MVAGPLTRRHRAGPRRRPSQRALIAAWVGLWALVFAALGIWGIGLRGAERTVDRWRSRWEQRLERGAQLLAAGDHEAAAAHLEAFDAEHPALFVKHGLDRQRERGLELLGASYVAQGKRGRALATFERLVAFDPRNAHSRWLLAEAQLALGEHEDALATLAELLAIHPTHLPGVRARVELLREAGDHAGAVATFEAYLDAWLLAPVTLTLGGREVELDLEVLVDGRPQRVSAPVRLPAAWSGSVTLCPRGHSLEIGALRIVPPVVSGAPAGPAPVEVAGWRLPPGSEHGARFSLRDAQTCVVSSPVDLPSGAARLELELTLFKAVPEDLWQGVRSSFASLLRGEELAAVEPRVQVGGCLEAGTRFED